MEVQEQSCTPCLHHEAPSQYACMPKSGQYAPMCAGGETLTLSSLAMSIPRQRYVEGGHTESCAVEAAQAAWNVLSTSPSQSCAPSIPHCRALLQQDNSVQR